MSLFLNYLRKFSCLSTNNVVEKSTDAIQGYYLWCYGKEALSIWCINSYCTPTSTISWTSDPLTNTIPSGTNQVYLFTGYVDPQAAINCAEPYYSKTTLFPKVGICLGGGNDNGRWSADAINKIIESINNGDFSKYSIIVFDIEIGDAGLATLFNTLFETTKSKGLSVIVTVSHSSPYGFADSADLMKSILQCPNVDYFSPQLYTQDIGTMNEYISGPLSWADFAIALKSNPNYGNRQGNLILPSIFLYNEMVYSKCGGLFYSGGTNTGNPPNFGYNSSGTSCNCDSKQDIYPPEFTEDTGANDFFTLLFGLPYIAGAIQWVNGNYQG